MLPFPTSPDFPHALKARRELRGMSRAQLARAADIHEVMPRRYEEPDCGEFTRPRPETWVALNRALGYELPTDEATLQAEMTKIAAIEATGLLGSGPLADQSLWEDKTCSTSAVPEDLLLKDASLEDIVKLLHSRNIEPTFRHLIVK
jgi:transcriptional regulator with XRE-family HTH domain